MTEDLNTLREALEPCPFCGGKAVFFKCTDSSSEDFGAEHIACDNKSCGVSTNLMWSSMDDCKPLLAEKWNRRAPRLEAAAAAEYERGRQDGMKQEHALWQMQRIGQEIEAAAVPELSREDVVRLAREAGFSDKQMAAMFYDSGPYEITTPTHSLQRFASLVRSVPVKGNQS